MEVQTTSLEGVLVIHLDVFQDDRGFFVERFNHARFAQHGLPTDFVQDNHSRSAAGVLRGLHYQTNPAMGKLVGCTRGRIWDVAVDIRSDSPTFGQHFGTELTGENGQLLWVPAGFAHGFCVLGEEPADVLYKCTAMYEKTSDAGIAWDDADLSVAWPLGEMVSAPKLSERDKIQPCFAEYRAGPPSWNPHYE